MPTDAVQLRNDRLLRINVAVDTVLETSGLILIHLGADDLVGGDAFAPAH